MPVCRKNDFTIVRCDSCGLVRVEPPPTQEQLAWYYREAYNQYRFSFDAPLDEPAHRRMRYLRILERFRKKGRLLDVGSAYGHFMENARRFGWRVEGVEPLSDARILAASRFRLTVHESIDAVPTGSVDAATLWHVIEHITTPREFLGRVAARLAPGGILALATPNIASLSARVTGESWSWLSPPDHVVLYSPVTLRRLLEEAGFEVLHLETHRGPAKNILLLLLQGAAYRLGLFGALKTRVHHAVREYHSSGGTRGRFSVFYLADRITEGLAFLLTPLIALVWRLGWGDEVLVVARKQGSS
jgi:SAM-dependent methyltransferase